MRPINSDALGEKGERRFQELCADAELFCNKVGRDRTGWDFMVEFPFPAESSELPLDRRPQPLECRVQVKTVWSDRKKVKIRLSAAERIAKLLSPTFIFVLTVGSSLEFDRIYCIHIIDDVLSEILMTIRKYEKNGIVRLNREFIILDYTKYAKPSMISGKEVKEFIEKSSKRDMQYYIRMKNDQISNLGVIGNRYSGSFILQANSERELVDILLGVSKGKLIRFSLEETRFGIELPQYHSALGGEVSVMPKPRKGRVILRNKELNEIINIDVDITVPSLPQDTSINFKKMLIRNEFVEFVIELENSISSFHYKMTSGKATSLNNRLSLNKIIRILSSSSPIFELRSKGYSSIKFEFVPKIPENHISYISFEQEILSKISKIVDLAGGGDIDLSDEEMNSQLWAIRFVHDICIVPEHTTINSLKIIPTREFPPDLIKAEALFVTKLVFGKSSIAFCGIAALEISDDDDLKLIKITRLTARELNIIDQKSYHFDEYIKDIQLETAINIVINIEAKSINGKNENKLDI